MTKNKTKKGALLAAILLTFTAFQVKAQQPLSGDVQTNTIIASSAYSFYGHDITISPSGQYAVTWTQAPVAPLQKVYSRSYTNNGTANTAAQTVANNTPPSAGDGDIDPAISMDNNGNYIVVYAENNNTIVTSSNYCSIFYQRYNANGTVNGARVFVDNGVYPDIDIANDGTFNITYISGHYFFTPQRVYVKRYLANGVANGARITVQDTPSNQGFYNPVISSQAGNAFYISYQDGNFGSPKMEFFNTAGNNIYNPYSTTGNNTRQLFAVKPNGEVVSVGIDVSVVSNSPYTEQIRTKVNAYNPVTNVYATPVYLSGITTTDILMKSKRASIGINNAGTYIIAFPKFSGSSYLGIYLQQYTNAGTAIGPEYPVSTVDNTMQSAVLDVSDCSFTVSWILNNTAYHKRFSLYTSNSVSVLHSQQYCNGSNITVSSSVTGTVNSYYWSITQCDGSGNPVAGGYSWTGSSTNGTPGVFTFPSSSNLPCNQYYKVELFTNTGCQLISDDAIIYYRCSPTPVITASAPNPLCFGQSVTLSVNYSPSSSTTIYWSTGSSATSITVNPASTQTYTVTVTSKGCTASTTYTVVRNNNINNPGFTLNASATTGNPYFNATATPLINPSTNGISYYWDVVEIDPNTGNEIAGTKVYNPSCWWTANGVTAFQNYSYLVTYNSANNGLSNPANFGCSATAGRFESNHTYRITRATWSASCPWTAESQTVMLCPTCRTANGNQLVVLSTETFGSDNIPDHMSYLRNTVGIQQNGLPVVNIFPNPSTGLFNIIFDTDGEKQIQIYDATGKIISDNQTTAMLMSIDLSAQPSGLYLCRIITSAGIVTKHIIIE
jgi:Secretion system C-terminal sorting domain